MLELLMDTWAQQRRKDREDIEAAVRTADPGGRGIGSPTALRGVLRILDPALGRDTPDHVILHLFREALRSAQGRGGKRPAADAGAVRNGVAPGSVPGELIAEVLLWHGVVGLRTHRLPPEKIEHQLPWDEFKVMEESWSGMRCEIEQMLVISEQLPTKAPQVHPPHTPAQLKRLVRSPHDF
jgi:hypothetical protein